MISFLRHVALALAATSCLLAQEAAQPPLPATTLTVNGKAIHAEVADDPDERSTGLMYRKSLEPDSGMLFVMPRVEGVSFWMRNTTVPLSIAYIHVSGTILEIHDLEPLNEKPVVSKFPAVAYALEMEQGWFAKNNIVPGARISGLPPMHPAGGQ